MSKDEALAWLAAEGYAKARIALSLLGREHSSKVILLQAHQLDGLAGIKPVTSKRMCLNVSHSGPNCDRS